MAPISSWGIPVASEIAADVAAVDAFLADGPKSLAGPPPEFGVGLFHRQGVYEWRANWPIADSLGVVGPASLRFVIRPGLALGPSISLIFNRQAVARLNFVPTQECESNPLWAAMLGLPARVCGPHFHSWEHNRAHVLTVKEWRRGPRARSSYSAVSHTSRKVRKPHRSGQLWMGPSIVPKLAIAPVFTAFTCALINFGVVEPGTRTVAMTRSARGQRSSTTSRVENSVRTRLPKYRVDAAQRLGIAIEYRDIGARAARLLHCIQKRSRYSSSRLSPSRLVYSQRLFVEIRSDWRRRTVEKPAR